MQIQDLPDTGFNQPFTLPLYVGGTVGGQPLNGSFTFRWKLNGQLPAGWNISLMDDAAQKRYTMTAGGELTFQYDTPADLTSSGSSTLAKQKSGVAVVSARRSISDLPRPMVFAVPDSRLSVSKGAGNVASAASAARFRLVISANSVLTGYLPTTPEIELNYLNPFHSTTNIAFTVPGRSHVTIQIFNVLGRKVATVTDQEYPAGRHVVMWTAGGVASGMYYCRMIAGEWKKSHQGFYFMMTRLFNCLLALAIGAFALYAVNVQQAKTKKMATITATATVRGNHADIIVIKHLRFKFANLRQAELAIDPQRDPRSGEIEIVGNSNSLVRLMNSKESILSYEGGRSQVCLTYNLSGNPDEVQTKSVLLTQDNHEIRLSNGGVYYLWVGGKLSGLQNIMPGEYSPELAIELDYIQ